MYHTLFTVFVGHVFSTPHEIVLCNFTLNFLNGLATSIVYFCDIVLMSITSSNFIVSLGHNSFKGLLTIINIERVCNVAKILRAYEMDAGYQEAASNMEG